RPPPEPRHMYRYRTTPEASSSRLPPTRITPLLPKHPLTEEEPEYNKPTPPEWDNWSYTPFTGKRKESPRHVAMPLKRERSEPNTGRPLSPIELPTPPGSPPPSQTNTPSDWGLGKLYPSPKEDDTEMAEQEEETPSEEFSPLERTQ